MASYTPNLELYMKDPVADGADTFNIQTMLNENWEKIDRQVLRAMAAAAAYDAGKTYQKGDFCTRGGLLYRANQAIAQPESWTAGHWTAISITDVIRGLTAADVGAVPTTEKGTAGGVAALGSNGQVPYGQLPVLRQDAVLYVNAATGSDSNPGTQQAPFATIQAALNSLPVILSGGNITINIAAGVYAEDVYITNFVGGSSLHGAISLVGAGQDNTFIQGTVISSITTPVRISNLHISKGNIYGMCGGYFNTLMFNSVTIDGLNSVVGSELNALVAMWGGQLYLTDCTFLNAPKAAIQSSGLVTANNIHGSNNAIGFFIGMSPGYLSIALVDTIPSGFAITKIVKDTAGSVLFEGGVLQ